MNLFAPSETNGTMWKWAIAAGLIGCFLLHPAVMLIGHMMLEPGTSMSLDHVISHEIKSSFSWEMLPWSLAFTLGAALFGGLYGYLKGVEHLLRKSRVRYQTVVDDQLDYIYRCLPDGRCTFVNDALCRLIGRPRDALLNQSLFEVPELGDPLEWRTQVERLSPDHPNTSFELQMNLSDGAPRWIRWITIAIADHAGKFLEYQSVGHDITALKQAQHRLETYREELELRVKQRTRALDKAVENLQQEIQERIALEKEIRENEFKYRLLFESVPMGIALTTDEGRLLTANSTLLTMLKLEGEALDRIDVKSLYVHAPERERLLSQLRTGSLVEEVEVELRRRDGTTFYASLSMVRFKLDNQEIILAVVNDISQRKAAIEGLRRSEADLRQLSARLMTVQEEERKRIAGELHDSVGQLMHALKFALETALQQLDGVGSPNEVRPTLERMLPILQEAAAENRRIVMDLHPSMLDDLGLLATVNWFCREFGRIYKTIAIEKTIAVDEDDIPMDLRVVFFRIIQEAFNNVAKHSRATRVRLTIAEEGGDLVVEIEDNGIGLQQENMRAGRRVDGGFGLSSMRERARASGGLFELTGASGVGTRVRVIWTKQGGPKIKTGLDWQI